LKEFILAFEYTVVIPAYNATKYLGEALDSVFSQIVLPKRVIVVDDASTDDLAGCVADFGSRVEVIRQESNQGPGAATTVGIAQVTTALVATLDADDLWNADKMSVQIKELAENADLDGVFAQLAAFGESMSAKRAEVAKSGWARSTMVLRTRAFNRVGPMVDPPGRRGELIDWLDRARHLGLELRLLAVPLAQRRLHADSLTFSRSADSVRGYLHVARAAIERRKAKVGGAEGGGGVRS
jgi:glycosyltransferase involved in cell wall biosynthesis